MNFSKICIDFGFGVIGMDLDSIYMVLNGFARDVEGFARGLKGFAKGWKEIYRDENKCGHNHVRNHHGDTQSHTDTHRQADTQTHRHRDTHLR